ncbi:MAG: PLDc N-terminal domain-containing protein, partial [Terrimesophilobacter sp.]
MDQTLTLWIVGILVAIDFIIRVVSIIAIPRNRRPQTAMAWLLAIFFIPYFGILLFLLLGSRHLPKSRRDKQEEINEYIREATEGVELLTNEPEWPGWLEPIATLN